MPIGARPALPAPLPAAAPERAPRRGHAATEAVVAIAERLGLTGPLGDGDAPDGAHRGSALLARLERGLLADAALAWDTPRLRTALTWFEAFDLQSDRQFFLPAQGPHAHVGQMWNRRSLDLLTRFIVTSPPLGATRGTSVSQDVAQSYTSAVYLFRCRQAGYDVAPAAMSFVAPLAAKSRKRKEAPATQRRLCRGFRAVDFTAAMAAGFDRSSPHGAEDWAAGLAAHNMLLRGGEVGISDDAHPEPHRVLRGRSFSWREPTRASRGRMWILVMVVPIKDPSCSHRGYPTPVARRHDGLLGADPLCTYDALAMLWWSRIGGGRPFPVDSSGRPSPSWWSLGDDAAALSAPMFTSRGRVWRTSSARDLFRALAFAAGLTPSEYGAKSGRIGGATDARDRVGDGSADVVKRRGRWASDVAEVYQRELLGPQLDLSASLADAVGEDLERMCLGWAQPGR